MKSSCLVALVFIASTLSAQQAQPAGPPALTGQVTGRVVCGDTDAPGRFASVQLIPEKPSDTPMFDPSKLGKDADFTKMMSEAMKTVLKGSSLSTLAALDGSFSLDKVPPGTYYVIAQLPGYQSPLSQFSTQERTQAGADTMKAVKSAAEKIVVQASQSAHIDVRLERGASLSGVIRYDDGSPASGVSPILMAQQTDGKWKDLAIALMPSITDDRGHYRFYGLAGGKYAVKATLPTIQASSGLGSGAGSISLHMNTGDALVVYSGGALRQKDVKPIEVAKGDEVDGVDITFPLSDLHVVSGSVVAKSDTHPVNAGTVTIVDSETHDPARTTMIDREGSFRFNYVPDGQYVLKVSGAADVEKTGSDESVSDLGRMMNSKPLKSYGLVEQPLVLKNDAIGLTLQVPDAGAAKPPASQ
jgi:hypothetical protein